MKNRHRFGSAVMSLYDGEGAFMNTHDKLDHRLSVMLAAFPKAQHDAVASLYEIGDDCFDWTLYSAMRRQLGEGLL